MTALTAKQFTDEATAMAHLEGSRWPDGVATCPHCGSVNTHKMAGKTQAGMFQCNDCRDKFTGRTGTVMERSKIPVHKWLLAIHLMTSNKNGVSAHELHRGLGITYKSAWFLAHRIREAMGEGSKPVPMGNDGGAVQADETFFGGTSKRAKSYKKTRENKNRVVALIEQSTGRARAFRVNNADIKTVSAILYTNVERKAVLVTDQSQLYVGAGKQYADHQTVIHSKYEYVNKDGFTTNNVENYFLQFKRGVRGTYIHMEPQHLQRYLNEFSFRYSNRSGLGVGDAERAARALKGIEGKRLTYRRPDQNQV